MTDTRIEIGKRDIEIEKMESLINEISLEIEIVIETNTGPKMMYVQISSNFTSF